MKMKDIEPLPSTAEEILEDLIVFHDPDKIKDTIELLLECYISSHVIDTHSRSKKVDIYTHVEKIKELLEFAKMWEESKMVDR